MALWSCALSCSNYFNVIQVVGLVLLTVGGGIGPTHVTSVLTVLTCRVYYGVGAGGGGGGGAESAENGRIYSKQKDFLI